MNKIQSKDHQRETYETKRFLCFALMIKYASKTVDVMD